jgi:D-3-phosphoglycerate dehydrogenase
VFLKPFKVLVPQAIAIEGIEFLKQSGCEAITPESYDEFTLKEHVKDCDAILVRTAKISRELIESAPSLKVIARHGIGLDNVDIQAATERNIYVCNAPSANINSVAENVVGMILAISHQLLNGDCSIRKGDFESRNHYIGTEVKGKTLGLVGLGNIGRLVAEKCALGLGMKILAYDPFIQSPGRDYIEQVHSLEELLKESDYVSLHVPYSDKLHHFIDEDKLKQMKPTAFLINAARGGLVDEKALYDYLSAEKIAGAGLDCFEEEPTPLDHPLWNLENVIVTPHMAAHSKEAMIAMAVDAAKEIVRIKNNQTPENCVNNLQLNLSSK